MRVSNEFDPDPSVILSGGVASYPADDVTFLGSLPEARPVGFTVDPHVWARRCRACDRLGMRGFTRDGDHWACTNQGACERRR